MALRSALALAIVAAVSALTAQTQPQQAALTVVRPDGRSQLPITRAGGRQMLALADLSKLFQLAVREDPVAGGVTVSFKNRTIVLAPGQNLASVGGKIVSLSAAATRAGDTWLVPLDFMSRALAPIYDTPIELRAASGLVIVGNVRVPRVAVRHESGPNVSQLILDVTPSAKPTITLEGRRLVIRFAAPMIDAAVPRIQRDEYVQAVRPGDAELVVEVGSRFRTYRASQTGKAEGLQLTIDLAPSAPSTSARGTLEPTTAPSTPAPTTPAPGTPAPGTPAPGTPAPGTPAPSTTAPPSPGLLTEPQGVRTIVLDPGHGGEETGAQGPGGTLEKDVTLAVARHLKSLIENRLGLRVLLTRSGDQTVALDQRAAFANNNKADLFISLHANASVNPSVSGAAVLYLNLDEYGPEARSAALQAADAVPALGGRARTIAIVPWDLAQAPHIDGSAELARLVDGSLRQQVTMCSDAPQQAPLRVLVGANMPAVMVEMGFLTNPAEEGRLRAQEFQTTFANALYQAIERFRAAGGAAGGRAP